MAVAARNRRARPGRGVALVLDEFQGQVIASTDDAHEFTGTGTMDIASEQTAIGHATGENLEVVTGVRFQNVTLAQGTPVQFARLRFVSRYYNVGDLDVTIRAQASDDAPAFTTTAGDISGRALTTASVPWTIPTWNTDQDDTDTRSPDVASVVQEVVNRPGWVPGNSIVFVISRAPAENIRRRYFHAYAGASAKAARVSVNTAVETPPDPPLAGEYGLLGDPTFTTASLTSEQQTAYAAVWAEINDAANWADVKDDAESDDIFKLARGLASHVQAVLIVFRATGDLALLDHIDAIAQLMRSKLDYPYRGTNDGTDGTNDGYLKWVFRPYSGGTDSHVGKDTRLIDDLGAHANAAAIAAAFEVNRGLAASSPGGVNYAERADFWKDYLVNHFEAKHRARTGKAWPEFPLRTHGSTGTFHKWMRWHLDMGTLTGESAYTAEAESMADIFWDHIYAIDTPAHPAYVWAAGIAALGGANSGVLNGTTYARHFYGNSVEFHLDNFHQYGLHSNMSRFARTFTEFICDTADWIPSDFAPDVGGGVPRLHLSPTSHGRIGRFTYRDGNYGFIAPWDTTGQVAAINDALQSQYVSSRDTIRLAAAIFFSKHLTVETG